MHKMRRVLYAGKSKTMTLTPNTQTLKVVLQAPNPNPERDEGASLPEVDLACPSEDAATWGWGMALSLIPGLSWNLSGTVLWVTCTMI